MLSDIEKLFSLYNEKQTFMSRFYSIFRDIVTLNFGSALKKCFVGNRLNTLSVEEKNLLLTQELRKIISTRKYDGNNTSGDNWEEFLNHVDELLKGKLGEDFQLFYTIEDKLPFNETIKFSEFVSVAEELLGKCNDEEKECIIKKAKTLEGIACPLTKKYFLLRYLAKAIICEENSDLLAQNSYQEEKGLCLILSRELQAVTASSDIIKNANERFSSERKYVDRLLRVSDKVSNYSGKIAAIYVGYIAAITYARYAVDAKDSEWYQLVALPSTILAMLQIAISFPQIIWSSTKAKSIRNYVLEDQNKGITYNTQDDKIEINDIRFLDRNIPTFSNNAVYKFVCFFRWIINLSLQPIDLVENSTKDQILRWSAIRWITPAGVIEEQSRVAYFVNCELKSFLYNCIQSAANNGSNTADSKYINRVFYLLYQEVKGDKSKEEHLGRIYKALTGEACTNFEEIISSDEQNKISRYKTWSVVTYIAAALTLVAEYICFSYRNQNVDWYEDPVFYAATTVKFMRLFSLLASRYCGNKITEYLTGNKLDNNIYFQDLFYNNTARMAAAVIPLIMFESTKDIKILSIATAIDVLTTVRSDTNSGKALSTFDNVRTEEYTTTLKLSSRYCEV